MQWFPSVTSIKLIFIQLQDLYDSLKKERLMNERTLEGVVDKVFHGEPFQQSSFWDRASILIRDLILEHPFTDGNKRVAFLALTVFLNKNGYDWKTNEEDLIRFTLDIASGQLSELKTISKWIKLNTTKIS